ncbi:MAG: phosphopantetheine-binding protein [Bacteroidota bacterium]|jgi:acyl carrier protein
MSATSPELIKATVRKFLEENMPGVELADDTLLISNRLMDSIVALKLVSHLETAFNIEFEAHEVDQDNLDSINVITAFTVRKCQ